MAGSTILICIINNQLAKNPDLQPKFFFLAWVYSWIFKANQNQLGLPAVFMLICSVNVSLLQNSF